MTWDTGEFVAIHNTFRVFATIQRKGFKVDPLSSPKYRQNK